MKLADIYMNYQSDIVIIEQELETAVKARHDVLRNASTHLLKAGGKRIRPVFVLLAAQYGNYDIHVLKHIAVPLELIHMASLVHDDVIDDAELRRGRKTVKSQWDNRVAMYTGDYIFGRAVESSSYFSNMEIHKILSYAMLEMCIGEVEQIRDQYNLEQNLRVYLRRIKRKTALLIAVSCQLGALAAETEPYVQKQLFQFGYYVGMSFQITDDILDFVGTEKQLGKPAGEDLRQGNVTLPALYAMTRDKAIKQLIEDTLEPTDPKKAKMEPVLSAIKNSGGIEYATEVSDRYLKKAYKALAQLPDSKARQHFRDIAAYIGQRKF